jgi:pimeloyl-ACP methyl ester carboxylesterase
MKMQKNRKKIQFNIVCFLFILSGLHAQEESIILKTTTGDIDGTLAMPVQKQNIPVVLLISGSGPTDRNGNNEEMENNSLKFLSEELTKNRIASVRFDKRGIAKSRDAMGEEKDLSFDNFVGDVKGWIDLISKDKRFSKLIVAGHSEGSLLGMIASVNNKKVSAFISIAGAGRSADEVLKEQMKEVVPSAKTIIYSMIDTLKKGDTIGEVPLIFYPLFRPSIQQYMISWFKYDPQKEIKKLDIPVLILQGTTDIQVKEIDANQLAAAQPKAELKIIKNMNHVLKDCDTTDKEKQIPIYSDPALPVNKEFAADFIEFIKKLK